MRRLGRQAKILFVYFSIPAIGAIAPLLVIPAISSRFGSDAWGSVAIAQSVGGAAAIIAELGWGVVGPQRVARVSSGRRFVLYRMSLSSKAVAVAILIPIVAIVVYQIAPSFQPEVTVLSIGACLNALSPTWFFIGAGEPTSILKTESIPRVVVNVASAVLMFLGASLMLYSVASVLLPLLVVLLAARRLGPSYVPRWKDFRNSLKVIRNQWIIASGRAISVAYTTLPIAIVGAVSPAAVPVFAAVERLMRMSLSILAGVPSRLQSWIGGGDSLADRDRRSAKSLVYNLLMGIICGLGFAVLAPVVAIAVFAGTIEIPYSVSFLSGALLCSICLSRGLGLSLVAAGKANHITAAIAASAITGTASIILLTASLGAPGAVIGELAAELTGVAIQIPLVYRYFKRFRRQIDEKHDPSSS